MGPRFLGLLHSSNWPVPHDEPDDLTSHPDVGLGKARMALSSDPGSGLGEPFPPRRPAPSCVELQQVGCPGCQRWHQDRQAPGRDHVPCPSPPPQPLTASLAEPHAAQPQVHIVSPPHPTRGHAHLEMVLPVPAGSNAVCPLEQLNIYIDVAFPSPSAPVALSSDLSVYAWIHLSDYDSEKKRKKKRTHVS